ncbi:MAG: alpha/beta hydrolase [Cyanobacteria bacterium J06639_1]
MGQRIGGFLASGLGIASWMSAPAIAAETISATAGPLERTISVDSLEQFLEDGTITRELRWYADQLTEQQLADLRRVLQEPFEIDPVTVARFARLPEGEALLRRLTVLIENDDRELVLKSMRAALTLAAFDEDGLTIANAIRNYPLRDLRVNVAQVLRASNQAKQLFIDSKLVFDYVRDRSANPADPDAPEQAIALRQPGEFDFTQGELTFFNPARPDVPGVRADIYVPSAKELSPLIIISHGVASSRETFRYLAEHLASHGFAVAAIAHPDTDELRYEQFFSGFAIPPEPDLFLQRPQDISSLLDEVERSPRWGVRIETERVGVIGQSLGGYTVLAAAGAELNFAHLYDSCRDAEAQILPFNLSTLLQCRLRELPADTYVLQDDRVAAVLALNPVSNNVFGPDGMAALDVPFLSVSGDLDFFAPAVAEQIYPFAWAGSEDKYLVLMESGTHFSFLRGNEGGVIELPEAAIGPDPDIAHPILQGLATAFFEAHINQSEPFENFIQDSALNPNAEPFRFAVSRSLSEPELDAATQ